MKKKPKKKRYFRVTAELMEFCELAPKDTPIDQLTPEELARVAAAFDTPTDRLYAEIRRYADHLHQ